MKQALISLPIPALVTLNLLGEHGEKNKNYLRLKHPYLFITNEIQISHIIPPLGG